jgi:hypothetical protein
MLFCFFFRWGLRNEIFPRNGAESETRFRVVVVVVATLDPMLGTLRDFIIFFFILVKTE